MQITVEALRGHRDRVAGLRDETPGERLFERLEAENVRSGPGNRDAHAAASLRDEHADERKARRWLRELHVGGAGWNGELDRRDELPGFQVRLEQMVRWLVRIVASNASTAAG